MFPIWKDYSYQINPLGSLYYRANNYFTEFSDSVAKVLNQLNISIKFVLIDLESNCYTFAFELF